MRLLSTTLLLLLSSLSLASAQDMSGIDFSLRDIRGEERTFQSFLKTVRGSEDAPKKGVVIISFWAMWCEPCKQEMKALRSVYEKFSEKNLHYIAINTDNPKSLAKVQSYVAAQKLPYNFWLDPNSEVFKKLNGQSMPYSLIVDEKGKLIAKHVGFIGGDEKIIEEELAKVLE